jgi:hypothetical protein
VAWIRRNIRGWRAVLLGLAVLSLFGPWTFDVIHVPAQYACSAPFVRLEGDFCGQPMPGIRYILWLAGGLVSVAMRMANGEAAAGELLFVIIFLLPFAPVVPALAAIMRRSERGSGWLLAGWLAGAAAAFLILSRSGSMRAFHAWGLWLYLSVALVAATAEAIALYGGRKPAGKTDPITN